MPARADLARILADNRDAVEADLAGVGPMDAGDRLHQRRLAGAIVADERDRAARLDEKVTPAQRFDGAEGLADVLSSSRLIGASLAGC